MEMRKVTSSNIEAVGYDNDTLAVQFTSGGTFHYEGVSRATYDKLMAAESIGKAFHAQIRSAYKGVAQPAKKP